MKEEIIISPIVPDNNVGKAVDLSESVTENNTEEAIKTFNRACKRLQNPATWHELSGTLSAKFSLADHNGHSPHRLVELNDLLLINIPGPGPAAGDGYDWVQVETLTDDADKTADESFGMVLRSAANPANPEGGVAHFFGSGATSTFVITRKENTVTASYHGRNETPNTKDVKLGDKIRNTVVAAAALAGFSELEWKALIKGFLQKEIGG